MKPTFLVLACTSFLVPGCSLYTGNKPSPDGGLCHGTAASYLVRNPETGQCIDASTCDPDCGGCPKGNINTVNTSWGACTNKCTGLSKQTCLVTPGCRAAYINPAGTPSGQPNGISAALQYYGCWATDETGPIEGGGCAGLDAYECSRHDDCIAVHAGIYDSNALTYEVGNFESCAPEPGQGTCYGKITCPEVPQACPGGTVPGILNGCYTGYCIPEDQCGTPPPLPACDTITDEATCIGRSLCTPIYQGQNCSCDASGACTCQTRVFSGCEDTPLGTPATPVDGGVAP